MIGSGISADDFVTQSLSQTLVIKNNVAVFVLGIEDDTVVEGVEQATIILVGKGVETSFQITESGTGGENEDGDDSGGSEEEFTITKPVAGEPITDEDGGIIYIPIVYPGGPYQTPPQVIIGGGGGY